MGGGTPIIEANRVGCDVEGLDINPMSVWIVREEIEPLDLAAYEQAAALAFDSRTTRFNVALKLFEVGELDRAMSHAEAAAAIDPWRPTPYRLMARIEREQGHYDEARHWQKKAGELQRVP